RSHLRIPGHRHLAVPGDPRERPFRHPGSRLHRHRGARPDHLRARRGLPLARPPHFVSPDVMRGAVGGIWRYLRRNPSLTLGVAMLATLGLFVVIGRLVVDIEDARPLSVPTLRPPSWDYPFGTDRQGRD